VAGVETADLKASLLAAKGDRPLYYRTDTHWNHLGAFTAFCEIQAVLNRTFPDMVIPDIEKFRVKECNIGGMDMGQMLRMKKLLSDRDVRLFPERGVNAFSAIPKKKRLKVLLFHDSYSAWFRPCIYRYWPKPPHFFVYIERNQSWFDEEAILKMKPDIVITVRGARFLRMRPYGVDMPD